MNLLKKVSIRNRLRSVFFLWLIIFLIFGLFAIMEVQELSMVTQKIYNNPLKVSDAASEARVGIIKIQRDMRDILLSEDTGEIQRQYEEIKALDRSVLNNFYTIKGNAEGEEVKGLAGTAEEIFQQWQESRQGILDLILAEDSEEAAVLSKIKNTDFVARLEETLDALDHSESDDASALLKEATDIEASQKERLFRWMVSLGVVSLLFSLFTIRSILTPMANLKEAMNISANTGELQEVKLRGRNEVVDISEHYNTLIGRLKSQFWVKDSQNSLNQELSGNFSLTELSEKGICFLCRTVDAGNGVLYLYDDESNTLRLQASFAFTERDRLSNQYQLGEGIIGQVALERKPILLKDVKKPEALITTGLFNEAPLNTYAIPLMFEGKLYGVLELSSFETFTPLKREFLNEAGRIISIRLSSAVQNQKIKELLEVSEEAQREANQRADELREANGSLEEQQRMLQQQTEELQQTNTQLEEQQQLLQQQSEELQQTNAQLEEQQQQLEEQSKLLNVQNEELEKSRQELFERSEQLEQSSKYKSEFLANMSHELRTPLNSIILLSKLMGRNGKHLSEEDLEKINVIHRSGQELLRLVNDILDLSKIEAGMMTLNVEKFSSSKLVQGLKQMFDSLASEKGIGFRIDDQVNGKLVGDQDRISQILRNFLSNAFKFTKEGTVTLRILPDQRKAGSVIYSVEDTGIGISEEKLSAIFEEFTQGDGSILRNYGGTGLGLSICKKMASLMGGDIDVVSELGKGSRFCLYLPGGMVCEEEDEKQPVVMPVVEEPSEGISPKDKMILIIEDDNNFARHIQQVNEKMKFKTIIANTGRKGLQFASEYPVDGILLGLGLPDMSGVEVLRELKSTVELRHIPVHVLSVWDKNTGPQKMGALGYHQKPVDEQEISQAIQEMITFAEKTPKKVLLVEDNQVQREAIKELIGDQGVEMHGVDTEEEAKKELKRGGYDAVILDLGLKEGHGINICKFIGEQQMEVPVIVYTGRELSSSEQKEIQKYADSIIIKTANSDERLLDEVTLFLHKIKKDGKDAYYLTNKTKEECALCIEQKKIMIVDDDARNVFVLAAALENYGAEIIEAENGKDALEKLGEQKVDLVLMDIMMPVMDGYQTMREIRKDPRLKGIPIIALTAKTLKGDREKCIEAGANDYIAKPVDYDVLIRLVKAWIEK